MEDVLRAMLTVTARLFTVSREEGCSAVVLGHHRDDILETFFVNRFHGGAWRDVTKAFERRGRCLCHRPLAHVARSDRENSSAICDTRSF